MFGLFEKKQTRFEFFPAGSDILQEGVYNRWKSSYLGKKENGEDWYSGMGGTIEYFILSALDDSQSHVVRVMKDIKDSSKFVANYSGDSRIFQHPVSELTASDILNAYPLSDFENKYAQIKDRFGLRRIGFLDDFVERMNSGNLPY